MSIDRRTLTPEETAAFEVPIEFCPSCQSKIDAKNAFVVASPEPRPVGAQDYLGALVSFRVGESIGTRYVNMVRTMKVEPAVTNVYLAYCQMVWAEAAYKHTMMRMTEVLKTAEKGGGSGKEGGGDEGVARGCEAIMNRPWLRGRISLPVDAEGSQPEVEEHGEQKLLFAYDKATIQVFEGKHLEAGEIEIIGRWA